MQVERAGRGDADPTRVDVRRVADLPVFVSIDRTVRVKIIDACGMTCTFCHNEGTSVAIDNLRRDASAYTAAGNSGRMSIYIGSNGARFLPATVAPDAEFAQALDLLREALGAEELHLTGGEPTLHPQLADIISVAREAGYRVCMTSNGENGARVFGACGRAGLDRVNFSIFGTTARELAQVQHRRYRDAARAQRKIDALRGAVSAARGSGIRASANIVVPNYGHAPRVGRLLEEYGSDLTVRLLNSLDDGEASVDGIYRILTDLGAVPVARYVTAGVSGCRTSYRLPDGRLIYFKQIRRVRLPTTCATCRFNNDTDCQEGYYGVRLYRRRGGGYLVGVCIQRMDLCLPIHEFVDGPLRDEIIQLRASQYAELAATACAPVKRGDQ